jgi:hypothetical protein
VEKVRKCEKSAKSAMRMQNANAMRKKCEFEYDAKKFSHYHPWQTAISHTCLILLSDPMLEFLLAYFTIFNNIEI